ncbi:hypothetical protein [Paenibacillus sp. UNC451MF]|uniref:hypothetical protein n=1 Tax=Paenibacillus sp. UNC451MF TaxID=1449063 RepID=UPI000491B161|nr:hypothetical protein [Paenibacillus sp. UNC451MF]
MKYNLSYEMNEESVNNCVEEIFKFILTEGFDWLEHWMHPVRLLNEEKSPINRIKTDYLNFQSGGIKKEDLNLSRMLLGIKE